MKGKKQDRNMQASVDVLSRKNCGGFNETET